MLFTFYLCAFILLWKVFTIAQNPPCQDPPKHSIGATQWKAGAVVSVYYRAGDFNAAEKLAIERAINSWNEAAGPEGARQ